MSRGTTAPPSRTQNTGVPSGTAHSAFEGKPPHHQPLPRPCPAMTEHPFGEAVLRAPPFPPAPEGGRMPGTKVMLPAGGAVPDEGTSSQWHPKPPPPPTSRRTLNPPPSPPTQCVWTTPPPPPKPHNQNTFGPTGNVQRREANRRRQRQTTEYRGLVPKTPSSALLRRTPATDTTSDVCPPPKKKRGRVGREVRSPHLFWNRPLHPPPHPTRGPHPPPPPPTQTTA